MSRLGTILAALGIAACLGTATHAASSLYNVTTLDPGLGNTIAASGINDNGVIIGTGNFGATGRVEIGIMNGGAWSYLSGGVGLITEGYKIDNNFDFVGSITPVIGQFQLGQPKSFAFINGLGPFSFDAVPGVANRATGVNNSGLVVGNVGATPYQATAPFANANISHVPGLPQGYAIKDMNNSGTIVGTFGAEGGAGNGFILQGGVLSTVSFPGAFGTYVNGISNTGLIVGTWFDSNHHYRGFVDDHGTFTSISLPGNPTLFLEGINNGGQIVGNYVDGSPLVGILLDPVRLISADQPAFIGDLPTIVGDVTSPAFPFLLQQHLVDFSQFVEAPEPSSVALAAVWLAGLVLGRRSLRRAGQALIQCSP